MKPYAHIVQGIDIIIQWICVPKLTPHRKENTFFNPGCNTFCQNGYIDISPKADGGVLKKVYRMGGSFIHTMNILMIDMFV